MEQEKTVHGAKIIARDIPISWKQSVEICRFIRKCSLDKAQARLQKVIRKEIPVPYTRYVQSIPHRRGNIATGRYPIKAATAIFKILKSLEANAEFKNLNTKNLMITRIMPNKAANQPHYGRKRRSMRSTHLEIHVAEK